MPSIKTVINSGKKKGAEQIQVQLHAKLTEIGTIEVWLAAVEDSREWRLEFDARAATETERAVVEDVGNRAGVIDESMAASSSGVIRSELGAGRNGAPSGLLKKLEAKTGMQRNDWPPALLRRWFEETLSLEDCRKVSPELEARWLNLTGYALRPGYGYAADDWRVGNLWKVKPGGVENPRNEMCRAEWWIIWRRVAGGLTEHQQMELASPLIKQWNNRIKNPGAKITNKPTDFQFGDHESAEVWRLLGSLERLPTAKKEQLGDLLLLWLERKSIFISNGAAVWALGRIGARVPAYGPLNTVVSAESCAEWLERLMALEGTSKEKTFALMHLARLTGDRYRDLPDESRSNVLAEFQTLEAPPRLIALVRDGGLMDAEEQDHAFGETLPPGLHLAG